MPHPLADIEDVKRIVVAAGEKALARAGKVDVEFKADQSLVTDADRENEQFIEAELEKLYPGYAFVGEEYGWRGPRGAPLWACDPIDGTTNFVCGLPYWCVSVGLLNNGIPELGALYLPRTQELFWAVRGDGAYCNGTRLQSCDRGGLDIEDTICFTSNAIKSLNTEVIAGRIRALGSIAAELAYTARGNLCATIGVREGIVDIAAALCICFEAGCDFRYLAGPSVDITALIEQRRTDQHFVYAPPRLLTHLQAILHPK